MTDQRPSERRAAPEPLQPVAPPPLTLSKRIRRLVFGNPISTEHADHSLLPKILALPVFSSDAISSVAYATQQIVLALGGAGLMMAGEQRLRITDPANASIYSHATMLITGMIVALLVIVVISYWQTIFGYPSGGGSYIVSKDNLGTLPGLIAASALLIDYVLTVAVSIAAGIQNLESVPLFGFLHVKEHLVLWCLLAILVLTLANLRGLKESGTVFALPTYGFVIMCYVMIGIGFLGHFIGWHFHPEFVNQEWGGTKAFETLGLVVFLRAFANGCSAMTGTEAVSNGIPAFREPKSQNAALTLVGMGVILGTIFLGISGLAMKFHVVYWEGGVTPAPAVFDQISAAVFGKYGHWAWAYVLTQVVTALILVLAANTSYADFPRLASILARDRFLPKQLSNLGDKLVFNNGIVVLGLFAALLIVVKRGSVDALIPLYAVGVFSAFTLSQLGMVVHWFRLKDRGWQVRAVINGVGALTTFLVLLDIAFEKFLEGAWIVIVLVAVFVTVFKKIYNHYAHVAQQLKMSNYRPPETPLTNTVLVLVPTLHRGVMPALEYARSLSPDCRAIHIENDPAATPRLKERWEHWGRDVPLVILNSPYRSLIGPIMRYLDAVQTERRNHLVTVVVPESVTARWWESLLHGNSGLLLKLALLGRRDVIVANVRYYLDDSDAPASPEAFAEEGSPVVGGHPH